MNPIFLFSMFGGGQKPKRKRPTSVLCPKCAGPAPISSTAHGKCTVACRKCKYVFSVNLPKP